jgi:hypothetical protein
MANLKPLFATAPRIKVYIQDKVVAYAVGFNLNVSVEVQPVFVLGQFAPVSLEPTMYNIVTGTMQIVRLSAQSRTAASDAATNQVGLEGALQQTSNSSGLSFGGELKNSVGGPTPTNSPLAQKDLFLHLDPSKLLLSESFDVKLYMKVPNANNTGLVEKQWLTVKNCRITSRNTNIAQGQLVNEPLSFQGLLLTHEGDNADVFELDGAVKQFVGP